MNIVNKLTVRHLLGNKKRSVVTILGIAVSTSLISAILLGIFSFFSYFGTVEKYRSGDIVATFCDLTPEQVNALVNDDNISMVGVINTDATISGVRLDNGLEDRFRIGNVAHVGIDYFSQRVVCDYEGTFPTSSDEAAVEAQFLEDNHLDLKPGDTLTYEQGYRYFTDEDSLTYMAGAYQSIEQFEYSSTETVTVTAILHGNRPTGGYDILRGMDPGYFPAVEDTDVYITLKHPGPGSLKVLKGIVSDYGIDDYVSKYGKAPSSDSATFVVEGLGEYASSVSQIPAEELEKMKTQGNEVIQSMTSSLGWKDGYEIEINCIGNYFLSAKSIDNSTKANKIYMVYKVHYAREVKDYSGKKQMAECDFYYWVSWSEMYTNSDGVFVYDLNKYEKSKDSARHTWEIYLGKVFGTPYNQVDLLYYGYENLDLLYNKVVTSNVEKYNVEENVSDTEPVEETTEEQTTEE